MLSGFLVPNALEQLASAENERYSCTILITMHFFKIQSIHASQCNSYLVVIVGLILYMVTSLICFSRDFFFPWCTQPYLKNLEEGFPSHAKLSVSGCPNQPERYWDFLINWVPCIKINKIYKYNSCQHFCLKFVLFRLVHWFICTSYESIDCTCIYCMCSTEFIGFTRITQYMYTLFFFIGFKGVQLTIHAK